MSKFSQLPGMRGIVRVDGLQETFTELVKPVRVRKVTRKYTGLKTDRRGTLHGGVRYRKGEGRRATIAPPKQSLTESEARKLVELDWRRVPNEMQLMRAVEPGDQQVDAPELEHGLSKVLQFPNRVFPTVGRAGRSHYFSDFLLEIPQPEDINWTAIAPFCPASRDVKLGQAAREQAGARYLSSTSSTTSALGAVYHLLSRFANLQLRGLSEWCFHEAQSFTRANYRPTVISLNRSNGIYAIDKVQGKPSSDDILSNLGHSMERMLTNSPQSFNEKFLLTNAVTETESAEDQAFNYTRIGAFLVRAQLDCMRKDTGEYFDLKSRAVAPIRWNLSEYHRHLHYNLTATLGQMNSYEREFYDMVRSCFIKYCYQVRLGRMAGVFVTYHNTRTCFGFEYLPLSEMDRFVFGNSYWAHVAFDKCMHMLERVLDAATGAFPEDSKLKVVLVPERSKGRLDVIVHRERGEDDPLAWQKLVDLNFLEKMFIKREVGYKDMKVDENDLAFFSVRLASYVNGRSKYTGAVLQPHDGFDLFYQIERTPVKAPAALVTQLVRAYDMFDMPRWACVSNEEDA